MNKYNIHIVENSNITKRYTEVLSPPATQSSSLRQQELPISCAVLQIVCVCVCMISLIFFAHGNLLWILHYTSCSFHSAVYLWECSNGLEHSDLVLFMWPYRFHSMYLWLFFEQVPIPTNDYLNCLFWVYFCFAFAVMILQWITCAKSFHIRASISIEYIPRICWVKGYVPLQFSWIIVKLPLMEVEPIYTLIY